MGKKESTMELSSQRLTYRKYTQQDTALLLALYTDWRWEGVNEAFALYFLEEVIAKQYNHGGGLLAVFLKENETYIGHCGLKFVETQQEWYLSFRFLKKYWRDNLPLEAINTCVAFGFNRLNLTEIVVDLETRNQGASKLLEAAGFKYRHTFEQDNNSLSRYSIFTKY